MVARPKPAFRGNFFSGICLGRPALTRASVRKERGRARDSALGAVCQDGCMNRYEPTRYNLGERVNRWIERHLAGVLATVVIVVSGLILVDIALGLA